MAAYMRVDKAAISRKDEVRTQFQTREGLYKLMNLSEYSRPTRFPQNGPNTSPLRVSFVSVVDPSNYDRLNDLIAFNISKELFAYVYNGVRKVNVINIFFIGLVEYQALLQFPSRMDIFVASHSPESFDGCAYLPVTRM
jgi:hypothetical protein